MLEETRRVTCDGCQEEIDDETAYETEFYLELRNVAKRHPGNFSYGMGLPPEIRKSAHFHDLYCLAAYVSTNVVTTEEALDLARARVEKRAAADG